MDENDIEISVVMPCLNEEKTIAICIEKAKKALQSLNLSGEIVISDNGSTDRSVDIAKSMGARVVHQPKKGYGNAYIKGLSKARGKYIVMADSDNTYDLDDIEPFITPLINGYDMVMGSRFKGEIMPGAMPFLHRYVGNPLLTGFLNLLFKTGISDAHCGIRSFTRQAFKKMHLKTGGMEFASEMVINASKSNLKIAETPVKLYASPGREPHLRTFRDGWRHLRFMLLYSPDYLFMIPGLTFFLSGLIFMLGIAFTDFRVLGVRIGPNSMTLGSFATLFGLQMLIFSIISKVYYSYINPLFKLQGFTRKIMDIFTLEKGIGVGLSFFFLGALMNLRVVSNWYMQDFGELTFFEIKLSLINYTLIMIGVEFIFASFLFSIISKK